MAAASDDGRAAARREGFPAHVKWIILVTPGVWLYHQYR